MRKYINIFSVLMLVVYGTLTIVAVPLHHHSQDIAANTHHSSTHTSHECGVCSFTSTSITFHPTVHSIILIAYAEKVLFVDFKNELSSIFSKEYPRRGPPQFLS